MPKIDSPKKLTKSILDAIGSGYEMSAGILFPGVAKKIKGLERFEGVSLSRVRQAVKRLQKLKLVKVAQKGEKLVLDLTAEGRKRLEALELDKLAIGGKWDGKWRMVLFAIPESQKGSREAFRKKLNSLGFYQIQRGVLVTPYPCDKEVAKLADRFNVTSNITQITATDINKVSQLKKHFNL